MIQIEAIHIREFRGIRDLKLDLKSKNFAIWGPNGSGKSGVVDAIDFALTGDIARLSGPGLGNVTVAKHAPHVHKRDDPAAAEVALTVRDTKTNKIATLTRKVKPAGSFTLVPDLSSVRAAVERAGRHSELTLSRREIIKFIVAEPTRRSEQVQALLKLDRLSHIRTVLKTTQGKVSAQAKAAESEVGAAKESMERHLDLPDLLNAEVASVVNQRRSLLGLEPVSELSSQTDLAAGVEAGASPSSFNKASAIRDVAALNAWVNARKELPEEGVDLVRALDELEADPTVLTSLRLRNLTEGGLRLATEDICPLCDLPWPSTDALRAHLNEKLERSQAAAELQRRIAASAASVSREILTVRDLIRSVAPHTPAGAAELPQLLHAWSEDLGRFSGQLIKPEDALAQRDRLMTDWLAVSQSVKDGLAGLLSALEAVPDQSAAVAASSFLIRAQERWARLRLARAAQMKAASASSAANSIYTTYCEVADAALVELYETVEQDFSDFYRLINSDDEADFKAAFQPSSGKLDLQVAFYGQGMFPPAAYHSEGHQDGMGVCLYLALVKQLLGTDFRFAVLDDVVMSVDSNHRRQFCTLLHTRFPDVQFIITTHDETWAAQMRSTGLVTSKNQARFRGWNVNDGPLYETDFDFWSRIEADLEAGEVPTAAHRLRRNLESIMRELTMGLNGQVQYRGDNKYDLGIFLSAVKKRHAELLKKAKSAATSWGDAAAVSRIVELDAQRVVAVAEHEGENWAVNAVVHYNEGLTLSKGDFLPVLEAAKAYVNLFSCQNSLCESFISVVQVNGHDEALQCDCWAYQLKLRVKK